MNYIFSLICALPVFPICIISYIIAKKRIHLSQKEKSEKTDAEPAEEISAGSEIASEADEKQVENDTEKTGFSLEFMNQLKNLSALQIVLAVVSVILILISSFRLLSFELSLVRVIRTLIMLEFLLFAAIIDLYTKKIPNYIPVSLMGISVFFLIIEFLFFRSEFIPSLVSCMAGSVIFFIVLFLVSVVTGGGFGMGDVKLITTMTMMSGAALSVYSLTFGLIVCMFVSLLLLFTRKGKIKDEIPFGPFIFIGYVISLILGNL